METEKRILERPYIKIRLSVISIALLFVLGIVARTRLHDQTGDMMFAFMPWYDYIKSVGVFNALGNNFSIYTPLYTYLLSLATLIPVQKIVAIKLFPLIMDFVNAFVIYKIIQRKYPSKLIPLLAAGIFLCLPTIFINSSVWGQVDSIYTGFLLITLYCFTLERPLQGMLAFSIAFAFKAQAIFLAPFLVVMFFAKRVKLWHFFLVPAIYTILCMPVILLGRSWVDALSTYMQQGNAFKVLSANAPNFYILIPNCYYQLAVVIGLVFASLSIGLWIGFTTKINQHFNNQGLILLAFISVTLLPFLLPKMHDRYFYPADVLSLVAAFYFPELWFLPLAYQIASGLSYIPYFWGFSRIVPLALGIAAAINAMSIWLLLKRQFHGFSNRNYMELKIRNALRIIEK